MSGTVRQRVLIVEDDPVFQKTAASVLGEAGFECVVTGDGLDAVTILRDQRFDVVLLDIRLPGINGLEVLERIGGLDEKPKVIVITGEADRETVVETVRKHAYQFVVKPVAPQKIVDVVLDAVAGPAPLPIEVISAKPEWVELLVPCQPNAPERVQSFMQRLEGDLPDDDRESVGRAFRELLQNAIEWGGRLDPSRKVRISFQRTRRMLMYRIADPGKGFRFEELEHAAVSNPPEEPFRHVTTREEKGMRPGGFGLLMTRSLVDELVYNEAHNEVLFVKYLDNRPGERPGEAS
jgi:CheY-like chemotaxis protein